MIARIPWLRTLVLAVVPLVLAAVAGGLLWLGLWLSVPDAATLAEAGPGVLPSVAALLGGHFEGAFVHVSSDGIAAMPLLVPVLAGLLIARWLPWLERHVVAGVGLVVTAGLHGVLLAVASQFEIYDPTSFQTADIAWNGLATVAFAAVTWATAWAVVEWDLARTVGLGLAASALLGSAGLAAGALDAGPSAVAAAAVAGLLLGPNLLLLAVAGVLGAEIATTGTEASTAFVALPDEFGWWFWTVQAAGVGLLALAAMRAQVPESSAEFTHRARDVAGGALAVVVAATTVASPRLGSGSDTDAWVRLAENPLALWAPLVLLIALMLVPLPIRARWQGETWPVAPLRALRETAERARMAATAAQPPGSASQSGQPGPTTSASSPDHVQSSAPAWQPPSAPPATAPTPPWPGGAPASSPPNPFGDDVPPPVSDAWRDVPAVPGDPSTAAPPSREEGR